MFERLEEKDPEHFAVKQYKKYKLAAGRTTKDFGAFMLRETLWFPPQFPVGLPEIYVSAAASIRQRKIGAAEGEELFVIALLGDAAVLDDGDAVGIANG